MVCIFLISQHFENRRKEIIKTRLERNEIENRKTRESKENWF